MTDPIQAPRALPATAPTPEPANGPAVHRPAAVPPPATQGQIRWNTPGLENLLSGYFAQIEIKIADSKKKAHDDFVEFWALKGFILTGTLGAGALEAYGKGAWVPALAFVATAFAVVDAIRPRGTVYRQHKINEIELTRLLEQVRSEWEIAKLKANPALAGTDLRDVTIAILEKIAVKIDVSSRTAAAHDAVLEEPRQAA